VKTVAGGCREVPGDLAEAILPRVQRKTRGLRAVWKRGEADEAGALFNHVAKR
jgi:hypothetical protein